MHLEQIYLTCLSQASYLIVDERTKTAAVVDPRRDVGIYLEKARQLGATIRHVLLTHFHADFLAGHLELRERTGATIHLGARGQAQYPTLPMRDGGALEFGDVRLEFLETPGHTPESVSIVVLERAKDAHKPVAVLTGDTLFIGDVGRPDLLVSAGMKAEELAGMLYDSLHHKLLKLPDETLVYPGHGAGSACGKNLSSDTSSTIGKQKQLNYALQPMSKAEFVRMVAAEQPPAPAYFAYDAGLNRAERPTLESVLVSALKPLALDELLRALRDGALLLDTRDADSFAVEHLRGALNFGLSGRYASWVGTLLDPARALVLVTAPGKEEESATRLGRIGFDRILGFLRGGMASAAARTELVVRGERISRETLAARLAEANPPLVVDVRTNAEWNAGHIEGALHVVLDDLAHELARVPAERELVVVCKSGYRSSIAASLLRAGGCQRVTDLTGGMDAWSTLASGAAS
ncbi:MAG: MBL fold metallo-hydrolase [Planctomycetes bacterium]|nr:MBL fold metallo-hydrolase [Planctomycetota bacterium]